MILSRYEEIHSYEVQPQIHINLYTGTTINKAFNKAFTTKSGLFSGYRIEFKRFHTKVQCVWINLTQKNNLEICANHYHIKAHNFHMEKGSILMLLLLCVDFFGIFTTISWWKIIIIVVCSVCCGHSSALSSNITDRYFSLVNVF